VAPSTHRSTHRDLAVVLYDLAWLLPRTVGAEERRRNPTRQSEMEIMKLLVRRPGLSVSEVARDLGMQASNVSSAVRALVDRGMLVRRAADHDARVAVLEATPAAIADRDAREQAWGEALRDLLGDLSKDDAKAILAAGPALRTLAERLAQRAA
jgi:DNA-binding MarR family transcriptional regulator